MMKTVHETVSKAQRPVRVVQFGEGNFLRGFVDYMIDVANERGKFDGSVAVVKPIEFGSLARFHEQDSVYTLILRGRQEGETLVEKRVITCLSRAVDAYTEYADYAALAKEPSVRFIVSNTTEAGIVFDESDRFESCPPNSYPGKLTKFLFERFTALGGTKESGLILLPVELIEDNGKKLRACVLQLAALWELGGAFARWVEEACIFCSTLVDRIITGYPRDEAAALEAELGYRDALLDTGEPFALWVIESDRAQEVQRALPLDEAGLPVVFTDDQRPYRERKVRILNGAHTSAVLAAYLAGFDYVGDIMADATVRAFMERCVRGEIAPTVRLPQEEVERFAASVFERFENPFIKHALLSISLNSVSKWKSRVLPSLKDSLAANGTLPACLTFSLAALIAFYTSGSYADGKLSGSRSGECYAILDDAPVLRFFGERLALPADALARETAANAAFWGEDLGALPGFAQAVAAYLADIRENGAAAAMRRVLGA